MAVRPILFSRAMVRALLDGSKTMTRRAIKPQPRLGADVFQAGDAWFAHARTGPGSDCVEVSGVEPGYAPGNLLWVREAAYYRPNAIAYAADNVPLSRNARVEGWGRRRTSIHMPRWASRLTLEVTEVRVERLQDISEEDATAEGWVKCPQISDNPDVHRDAARDWFMDLWESIHGKDSWAANPWVTAIRFNVHKMNVDKYLAAYPAARETTEAV